MADPYTVDFVKVLSWLRTLNGSMREFGSAFSAADIADKMAADGLAVSPRHVHLAIGEATQAGLMEVRDVEIDDGERFFMGLDITGQGLHLLEALQVQATAEGKKEPWLWSMVKKAGTLANLIHIVVKIARGD